MDKLGRVFRSNNKGECDDALNSPAALAAIKLPDSRALRVMSVSLFLTVFFLALPSLRSASTCLMIRASLFNSAAADSNDGYKILPILLRDLLDEGLIKKGHRGLVLGAVAADMEDDFEFLKDSGVDLLAQEQNEVAHQVFDFVFMRNFDKMDAVDSILKEDTGLVISPLGRDPSNGLRLLSSYKIVYLRRFESTVVAMRKTAAANAANAAMEKEVSCGGVTSEKKKAALKGLEDVYLEPPRRAALEEKKKTSFTSRKIKFLPDLLKDSLDEYPRRVFITDDSSAVEWFYKSYPMRDQEFEVYNIEVTGAHNNNNNNNNGVGLSVQEMGISNWLREKVAREDYVVMKAEAQVVEEMIKEKSLCLVDELFLECKNQWQDSNNGDEEEESGSKRAYWQCLALYGKVRDEGIAVHQWWD